jgi:hypothetical protein
VSVTTALDLAERIVAVAVWLTAAELLVARAELRRGGALAWSVLALRVPTSWADRILRQRWAGRVYDGAGLSAVLLLSVVAAGVMVAAPRLVVGPAVCLAVHILLSRRHALALDGSDDMVTIVLGAAVVRSLDASASVQWAAAAFLCGQACLAYLTSGLSKSQSALWWSGSGLRGTLTTTAYGHPGLARVLVARPGITRVLGPVTIAWECGFLLGVLAGPRTALVALAVAGGFHLACAFVMGLPAFVWSFGATFPAVYVVSGRLADRLDGAERALLVLVAALPLLAAITFFAGRAHPVAGPARAGRGAS